jgi:hypothetical protein
VAALKRCDGHITERQEPKEGPGCLDICSQDRSLPQGR